MIPSDKWLIDNYLYPWLVQLSKYAGVLLIGVIIGVSL